MEKKNGQGRGETNGPTNSCPLLTSTTPPTPMIADVDLYLTPTETEQNQTTAQPAKTRLKFPAISTFSDTFARGPNFIPTPLPETVLKAKLTSVLTYAMVVTKSVY